MSPGAKSNRPPNENEIARGLERVPQIAEEFEIGRSEARRRVVTGECPCGYPGVNPCWRMGGEAGCLAIR